MYREGNLDRSKKLLKMVKYYRPNICGQKEVNKVAPLFANVGHNWHQLPIIFSPSLIHHLAPQ